ncbi:ATP-binding protein [Arcobacter sp. CECT 8983]|uniref:ATP-binding protein n=1 Tax=Arcobacter sp. CECT 8983 TaxID=2044508 RepID=UPI00100C1BEA|nr:ATP-binding protein [Arcobacter sp. CECT 8983]
METKNAPEKYETIINTSQDIDKTAKIIAKSSVIYLSNFAIEGLKDKIELDFQNNFIEAIEIKDIYLNETLVTAYRDENNKIKFTKKLPEKYKLYDSIKKDIIEKKEYTYNKLGKLTIYFKDNAYYKKRIEFSKEENEFLKQNSILKICVSPNWEPFEKIEDGKYIGISSDILKILTNQLNIETKLVHTNTWLESLEKIKNKRCDILPLAFPSKDKQAYLNFTSSFIKLNIVVATKVNVPFFDNIAQVKDKTFAVLRGHYLFKVLKQSYPNVNIIEVDSVEEGLNKVEKKEIFGFIDNSIVINHIIQKNFIGSIAVSGKLNGEMNLSIATRKDLPILNTIFEKALTVLTKEIKEEIFNKWVKINYQIKTDYTLVWQLSIISLFIILITLYWNRKLTLLNRQLQKERNKAYKATKAKANFLANMSHEIRTPMNSIIGMSHLVLETELKKDQKEYIEKIDKSANSLLRIINDILDFSKIEAGKIEFHNAPFKLREVISDCIDYIDIDLEEKDLEFILEYDENLSEYYFGDKLRVSQVFTNILHNAVKFTQKGYIRLKIEQKEEDILYIEIEDTGIGLDKYEEKTIFESFSQGDLSTSKKYEGTGLGLAISKDLVQLMNGKIWVKSQKNKGSTFFVKLELKAYSKKDEKIKINVKPDFSNKTILLVEDNKLNQQIIEGILKGTKANLEIVSTGKNAIKKINNSSSIDLILMDIQMPDLDGYETTKIIRTKNKDIPIIALTANSQDEDIEKSHKCGMNDHLKKPIEIKKLYSTIKRYI